MEKMDTCSSPIKLSYQIVICKVKGNNNRCVFYDTDAEQEIFFSVK